ncbi:MAG TPA: sugar phosphate isomerase/epimerase, partial [Gemmatales bacterium]|nr:sugar phosphate isomerase/epimerase [Gemmatales bacterium]
HVWEMMQDSDYATLIFETYLEKLGKADKIIKYAIKTLHENRNLCEDFVKVEPIDSEEIAFCFDVDVSPETDIEKVQAALLQAAELASAYHVRLALEFRSNTRWCASIATAAALVNSVGSPWLGLCLDLFHYYTGPSKLEDLGYLNPGNLFAVQLCDLSGVARELAGDSDRIFPGEGDFALSPIIQFLKQIDYQGYVTVELMNPEIWKMKPSQVAEAAYTCLRMQLGQAAMPTPLTELARF